VFLRAEWLVPPVFEISRRAKLQKQQRAEVYSDPACLIVLGLWPYATAAV
jgi:hypothetical protein